MGAVVTTSSHHMDKPMIFVGLGALFVALSIPLIRRRIRPNALYGLRVRATFADEWVWYEANAKSGRDLLVFGVVLMVVPPALAALRLSEPAFAACGVILTLGGTMLLGAVGWRRANRMLTERRAADRESVGTGSSSA